MKTLLLLLIAATCYGQVDFMPDYYTSEVSYFAGFNTNKVDSAICSERGHIMKQIPSVTLQDCPAYIIDYPDSSVKITPFCNSISYTCLRCGYTIKEPDTRENREVIWRRK